MMMMMVMMAMMVMMVMMAMMMSDTQMGVVHSLAICSSAHSGVQGLPECPSAQVLKYPSAHHLGLAQLRLTFMDLNSLDFSPLTSFTRTNGWERLAFTSRWRARHEVALGVHGGLHGASTGWSWPGQGGHWHREASH